MASDEYAVGFYFSVTVDNESFGFQEVTGISKQFDVEEVKSGGENRFKYRLPTIAKYENLVLKRGLIPVNSSLADWFQNTLNDGLSAPISTKDISIQLLNAKGEPTMKWTFVNAYPVKYAVSDLHSQKNELLIETMELVYNYFTVNQ